MTPVRAGQYLPLLYMQYARFQHELRISATEHQRKAPWRLRLLLLWSSAPQTDHPQSQEEDSE